jgi:hypothetical protein
VIGYVSIQISELGEKAKLKCFIGEIGNKEAHLEDLVTNVRTALK